MSNSSPYNLGSPIGQLLSVKEMAFDIRTAFKEGNDYNPVTNNLASAGFFDDVILLAAINFSQIEYCKAKKVPFAIAKEVAVSVADDGYLTLPVDSSEILGVYLNDSGILTRLMQTRIEHEGNIRSNFLSSTQPGAKKWALIDDNTLKIIPTPSGSINIDIHYTSKPTPIKYITELHEIGFIDGGWYKVVQASATYTTPGQYLMFKTGDTSTTGLHAVQVIPPFIKDQHALKYAAIAFLYNILGTKDSPALSDRHMAIFNSLIGKVA